MRMLVPAPYQASAKKDKKMKNKEAESGLHHEGTSDAMSGGTKAPSSHEGDDDVDEEEEEEDNPPFKEKKRAASVDPERGASKRGNLSLSNDSDSDAEAIPKPRSRAKPPAESLARDLPQQSSSSGDLPPEMMESETRPQVSSAPRADDLEASLLAATAQAVEFSELKQKLKLADEDIVLINKRLDEAQDGAAVVETLRGELAQAKEQARVSNAAADKAAADLKAEQATKRQFEERISIIEQELKDATRKCKSLEEENKGKTKFGDQKYALLNRLWSSPDTFAELPKSAADAAQFFQAQEEHATEELFWS
nr:uncharacterized protein LOC109741826 [Aegilops tauschii subsp. strangulata]